MENLTSPNIFTYCENPPQISSFQKPSICEIENYLFLAGRRLLSLPKERIFPKKYGNNWPRYETENFPKFSNLSLKAPEPIGTEIDQMDLILNLVLLVNDNLKKRIVNSRILINPINFQHLYSFRKLGLKLNLDPKTVKKFYQNALSEIQEKLDEKTWLKIISH